MGFFYRTIRIVENGIKPAYVFDGKPPELKSGVVRVPYIVAHHCIYLSIPRTFKSIVITWLKLAKRFEKREEAREEGEEAKETGETKLIDSWCSPLPWLDFSIIIE